MVLQLCKRNPFFWIVLQRGSQECAEVVVQYRIYQVLLMPIVQNLMQVLVLKLGRNFSAYRLKQRESKAIDVKFLCVLLFEVPFALAQLLLGSINVLYTDVANFYFSFVTVNVN